MKNTLASETHVELNKYTDAAILKAFLSAALHYNLAFATWKLPGEEKIHVVLDLSGKPRKAKSTLNEMSRGFLFSPFINNEEEGDLFINADIYYNKNKNFPEIRLEHHDKSFSEKAENVILYITENIKDIPDLQRYFTNDIEPQTSTQKEDYIELVKKAIFAIDQGQFEKVVVSRNKTVPLKEGFNIVEAYQLLCDKYLNAFVSLISVPDFGTWIGATPETLIKINANHIFLTEALAGTQELHGQAVAEVSWTQKEIEEQALVSRYIINCFKKIRLRDFEEIGPRTIVAGNLLHLRTIYRVNMLSTGFPELGSTMLELLHPTSAVCGMPKEQAMDFILTHENYNRSYYSGYLGPVHFEEEVHLFVNLRCLQLLENQVVLYAGAGILGNSDPEKEWRETELKCQTMIQGMGL